MRVLARASCNNGCNGDTECKRAKEPNYPRPMHSSHTEDERELLTQAGKTAELTLSR